MQKNETSRYVISFFVIVSMWVVVYILKNEDAIIKVFKPEPEVRYTTTEYVKPDPKPDPKPETKPKKKYGTNISINELHEVFLDIINREESE